MGYERFFYHIFKFFLVFNPFFLDPDPYIFLLDPDSYQSSSWIRIRNEFLSHPGSGSVPVSKGYGSATLLASLIVIFSAILSPVLGCTSLF